MRSASAGPSPRRKTLTLWAMTALAAIGCAAAVLWWQFVRARPDTLAPGWTANVGVLAGDGVAGMRDGDAATARFADPFGVAVAADGAVYVADAGSNHRIRRISPDGRVVTLAGGERGFADGPAQAARFDTPSALAIDANGTLYVADTGNNAIRRITAEGHVSTIAGGPLAGYSDGRDGEARFNGPIGVAVDRSGRVIVADTYNDRIRTIDPDGTVRTLAGAAGPGAADGSAASFHTPSGVAVDSANTIYVADTGNGLIRMIGTAGVVTTPAWAPAAGLFRPIAVAIAPDGDLYITDERGSVVEIRPEGTTRWLAGSRPGFRDGPGYDARFRRPAGVAVAESGRIVVADAGNALIRLVAASSRQDLHPPAPPRIDPRFDAETFGLHPLLWPIAPIEGPHEVAGTLGEARGEEGSGRLHVGIDIRAEQGTFVHAVRDGVAVDPISSESFGSFTESLRLGPLTYMHIRTGRGRRNEVFDDPERFVPTYEGGKLVGIRVKRGARFAAGEVLGTVNAFNHVHLNIGLPGEEHNPLRFRLVQFEDTVAPTIARGGVRLYDELGRPLTRRAGARIVISGRVQIVVNAWDQANGNRPSRRLGLYNLGYQVLNRDGSPAAGFEAVRHTMRFDRLATEQSAPLVYAVGSGIPFYGRRRTQFLYIVTNTLRDGVASQGFWDTALLAPGDYIVRAWVADIRGNVAIANRDLPVTIVSPDTTG